MASNSQGTILYYAHNDSLLVFEHKTAAGTYHDIASTPFSTSFFTHIAMVKTSTTNITLFLDGVSTITLTISGEPAASTYLGFGQIAAYTGQYTTNLTYPGYYDELRVSSTARWVTTFTPSAAAYPNYV